MCRLASWFDRSRAQRVGEDDAIHSLCVYRQHLSQYDRGIRAQSKPRSTFTDPGELGGDAGQPAAMHPDVRAYLMHRGMDPSPHQQRRVSAELLCASDLAIAMSTDHQSFLFETFEYRAPLFNDICHGRSEPLLDIWEAIPTRETDLDAARHYAFQVMEYIWASMPELLPNLRKCLTVERAE
jgi:protein-tyrosine-phosphatase